MKIRIEMDSSLTEDEVTIRCGHISDDINSICRFIDNISISGNSEPCKSLQCSKGNTEYHILVSNVLFFETDANGVYAHTISDAFKTKFRLYELENILPKSFVRVSKSSIVNVDCILSIDRNITASSLIHFSKTHKQIYASRLYFKDLRNRLNERRV